MKSLIPMGVLVSMAVVGGVACAGRDDGEPAQASEVTALPEGVRPVVLFTFDQQLKAIVRLEDKNGDGDVNDEGERTLFFDATVTDSGVGNAIGLLARGPHEVLATDNVAPAKLVHLHDADGDGAAFGEGEHAVWFHGDLPNGFQLGFPSSLTKGPDGGVYFVDKNTLNLQNPESLYRAVDLNGDGDVDDPGEVTEHVRIAPPGAITTSVWQAAFDASGNAFLVDTYQKPEIGRLRRVDRVLAGTTVKQTLYDNERLFGLTQYGENLMIATQGRIDYNPRTNEFVHVVLDPRFRAHLIAVRADRSGLASASDVRVIWDEQHDDFEGSSATPRDFSILSDGTIVFVDNLNKRIVRLVDRNGDGDFNDAGEYVVVYEAASASPDGPLPRNMLSLAAVTL